jgi:hypothetical protein
MKNRLQSLRALLLVPILALALVVPAPAAESALEMERSRINQGYKLLGKQARSGKFDDDALAKAIAEAKTASQAAAKLVPVQIEEMKSASAKKKALAAYNKKIGTLTNQLSKIGALCKAKDAGKLKAASAQLKKMKKEEHDKFIDD